MARQTVPSAGKMVPDIKLISIELVVVLVTFIASLITMVFFIKLIILEKKDQFDLNVFAMLEPYINSSATSVMEFFTFFGNQYFLIPANLLLIAYTFFIEKNKWFAIKIFSVATSSLALMFSLKYIFTRPRPLDPLLSEVQGFSFPSGHAFMSFAFFGILIYMVSKKIDRKWLRYSLITLLLLITFIIGLSRVYLRVHYASDVITGFAISLVWLVISLFILNLLEKNYYRKRGIS